MHWYALSMRYVFAIQIGSPTNQISHLCRWSFMLHNNILHDHFVSILWLIFHLLLFVVDFLCAFKSAMIISHFTSSESIEFTITHPPTKFIAHEKMFNCTHHRNLVRKEMLIEFSYVSIVACRRCSAWTLASSSPTISFKLNFVSSFIQFSCGFSNWNCVINRFCGVIFWK